MGYFKDTVRGFSWMMVLRILSRAVAFFKIIFLARLLNPYQFGLFGVASIVLAFLEIITETGINVFLIQHQGEIDEYINVAWFVSILRGILISLIIIISAPLVSHFFKSPDSLNLILLISAVPIIRGFINPASVIFQKNLLFMKEFLFRFSIFVFDTIVAITFGVILKSSLCIVLGLIAGAILEVVLSYVLVKIRPKIAFNFKQFREVVGLGKWVTFSGIFSYLYENIDDVLVGKLLGNASLGIYQLSYRISSLPITEIADVFVKVTFPVYSKISQDKKRLQRAFFKSFFASLLVVLPAGLFIFIFSESIITLALGKEWIDAVPIIRILSIFGITQSLSRPFHSLFLSLKKQSYVMYSNLLNTLILGALIFAFFSKYQLGGIAFAVLGSSIIGIPFVYFIYKKLLPNIK